MLHPDIKLRDTVEFGPGLDAFGAMMRRRTITHEYAHEEVEFYDKSMEAIQEYADIQQDDRIIDIGCSSGKFIIDAALKAGIESRLIGLDIDAAPFAVLKQFGDPDLVDKSKFKFIKGDAKEMPVEDDSVSVAMALSSGFRVEETGLMIAGMRRIVRRGGLLLFQTNDEGHSPIRYGSETDTYEDIYEVIKHVGLHLPKPKIPAEGFYSEDIPDIIRSFDGLELIEEATVQQDSFAIITAGERLETWLEAIIDTGTEQQLPEIARILWKLIVDRGIRLVAEKDIRESAETKSYVGIYDEPFMRDPIKRHMFVVRNTKAA